jgi:hypothetical protein
MVIAGLFEKRDPSAPSANNDFYSLAMRALDLHQGQLVEMKASRANFLDQVSSKVMFNDASLKQQGNRTRNDKMRHQKSMRQFYCEVDGAPGLRRWRKGRKSLTWQSRE